MGVNIGSGFPPLDGLEGDKLSYAIDVLELYSYVNKIQRLGMAFEYKDLAARHVNALWCLHSAIEEVSIARAKAKNRKG